MNASPDNIPLLEGIRVLELGNFVAAPFAARLFGDFGAEVIKIENPDGGDELRGWRRLSGDTSMFFHTLARNKRSVALDLRSPGGQDAVRRLAAQSDVVIENFRPGTLERWGLGPDALTAQNPDLVIVRISGYGQTGPYRDRTGFGSAAEAFAGLRHITGEPDRPGGRPAASIGDSVAGLYAVIGALMLMLNKARGRRSDSNLVDVALYESVFSLLDSLLPDYDAYGLVRSREGGRIPGIVPTGSYSCAGGGEVVIGGNSNSVFVRLMKAIGRDDLAHDQTLVGAEARSAREAELNSVISEWTAAHDLEEVLALLEEAGVPAGPVYDAASIGCDPHFAARNMLQAHMVRVGGASATSVRFPGVVPHIPGHEGEMRAIGPGLGADTARVLHEVAGLTAGEIRELTESATAAQEAARG